jgi:hypothetical protein
MATVPIPPKASPASKYDARVAEQLARTERRVRFLDVAAGVLGLLGLTFGFALVMGLLHWRLGLDHAWRQSALILYGVIAAGYAAWKIVLPLRWAINPRYAALKLEQTLPGAKNSVVSWIDLRDANLPPAIQSALGKRAAKYAAAADIDRAVNGRHVAFVGALAAVAGALLLGLLIACGLRPLLEIFFPVGPGTGGPAVQRNQITVRQPVNGNTIVAAGTSVSFAVRIDGELPAHDPEQAPRLHVIYPQSNDHLTRPLTRPRSTGADWTAIVSANEVREGFRYRVTAGDAESPEYNVGVSFPPAITKFTATINYPEYVGLPRFKVQIDNRQLRGWKNSRVELRVQTNGPVEEAIIERFEGSGEKAIRKPEIAATVAPDDPDTFLAEFPLEFTGTYRIRFTRKMPDTGPDDFSSDARRYVDPLAYELIADPDKPPHHVELTKPITGDKVRANGRIEFEGVAEDDIGVKGITLKGRVENGPAFKDRLYRSDADLRLLGGGYLKKLDYKNSLELRTLLGEDGKPVTLKAGMRLEFWIEAKDACDYVRPDLPKDAGESKHVTITLLEPEMDPARDRKEASAAKQAQKQHEKKQDEERQAEAQKRQEQQQEEEAKKSGQGKNTPRDKGDGTSSQPKSQPLNAEQQEEMNGLNKEKDREEDQGRQQGGMGEQQPGGQSKQGDGRDEGKAPPADSKPAPKSNGGMGQPAGDPGKAKPDGDGKGGDKAGENKDAKGNMAGAGADGKEGGTPDPKTGKQGEGKDSSGAGMGMERPAEPKTGDPKASTDGKTGTGKNSKPDMGMGPQSTAKGMGGNPDAGATTTQDRTGESKGMGDGGAATTKKGDQGPPGQNSSGKGDPKRNGPGQSPGKSGPDDKTQIANADGPNSGPDKSDEVDPKNADERDLVKLRDQLRDGDKEQRKKALDKLDEIASKADNEETRDLARQMRDDVREGEEKKSNFGGAKGKDGPPDQTQGDAKTGPGNTKGSQAKAGSNQGNGANKGQGRQPGNPDAKGLVGDDSARDDGDSPMASKSTNPQPQRSTTLQLDPFDPTKYRDRVDRALNVPQAGSDLRPGNRPPEKIPDPRSPTTLPSVSGRTPADRGTATNDTVDTGRAQPPPAYRRPALEFTRMANQPEKK